MADAHSFQDILRHFEETLNGIRTGRTHPALIENVSIEVYGQATPLKQLASVSTPEPRLLVVQPWDPSAAAAIEQALTEAQLGLTVVVDGSTVRATLPELTAERREELVKLLQQKREEARISLRQAREAALKDLENEALSEDEEKRRHNQIEEQVKETGSTIDARTTEKEEAIRTV